MDEKRPFGRANAFFDLRQLSQELIHSAPMAPKFVSEMSGMRLPTGARRMSA
jgi:hypothetical protein